MADGMSDYRQEAIERATQALVDEGTDVNSRLPITNYVARVIVASGLLDRIAELTIENDRLHKRESWFDKNEYWRKQAVEYLRKVNPERAALGWSENTKHIVQEMLMGRDRIAELEAEVEKRKWVAPAEMNAKNRRIEQLEAALEAIAFDTAKRPHTDFARKVLARKEEA